MNYIDQAAELIKDKVDSSLLPDADTSDLFRGYAALMYCMNGSVTAKEVHDVWSAWAARHDPESQAIRPFHQLDDETKAQDEPFASAIRSAWLQLK